MFSHESSLLNRKGYFFLNIFAILKVLTEQMMEQIIILNYFMLSRIEIFLICQSIYQSLFNIAFFILFCRKVMKLDKLGDNLSVQVTWTTWTKFSFLLFAMALFAIHIILAYSDKDYWENRDSNFSLVNLLFLVNYTLELYIVLREVKKCEQRHIVSLIYWAVVASSMLVEVIVVENLLPQPNVSAVLQVLILLINVGLILITVIFQRVRVNRNQESLNVFLNPSVRTIESSVIKNDVIPSKTLYVQFNKQFQVTQKKQSLVCEFKIAVYFQEHIKIIKKSELDFIGLSLEMTRMFQNNREVVLANIDSRFQNMMRYGQERQKALEQYLVELTKTDQFYCPPLLQFLQLPSSIRARLSSTQRYQLSKKESLFSEEQQRYRVPFFQVTKHKNHILISNPDILELIVNKSREEIQDFHKKLVDDKKLSMQLIGQNPNNEELIHFFQIVVNRKTLWRSFAIWFGLGGQIQEKIYNFFDVWNIGFKNVELKVVGNEKNFDKDGRIHTLYLLSISKKINSSHLQGSQNHSDIVILKKRYSDFFSLNKQILKFIGKNRLKADKLPEMPPKISPFGSKTSPKARLARFDHYVKQLTKIQGINHCMKLLEFLEVDNSSNPSDLYENDPLVANLFEHSERSYFSDLNQSSILK